MSNIYQLSNDQKRIQITQLLHEVFGKTATTNEFKVEHDSVTVKGKYIFFSVKLGVTAEHMERLKARKLIVEEVASGDYMHVSVILRKMGSFRYYRRMDEE